jgi:hypothetical protein
MVVYVSIEAGKFNWDAIPVKTGVTADPAAGAQIASVTVPAGKRYLLISMQATCVADATVQTRTPNTSIYMDGTVIAFTSANGLGVTASQTKVQSFMANGINVSTTQYGLYIPLLELPAGAKFEISYYLLQAGDNLTAMTYFYKEAPL